MIPRHAVSADEYLRMGEAGVFAPDARLELIEGEIVERAPRRFHCMPARASLEDIDPDTERAARAFVAKVARQYELAGAILFGSRARRNHRPEWDHPESYINPALLQNISREGVRL